MDVHVSVLTVLDQLWQHGLGRVNHGLVRICLCIYKLDGFVFLLPEVASQFLIS